MPSAVAKTIKRSGIFSQAPGVLFNPPAFTELSQMSETAPPLGCSGKIHSICVVSDNAPWQWRQSWNLPKERKIKLI